MPKKKNNIDVSLPRLEVTETEDVDNIGVMNWEEIDLNNVEEVKPIEEVKVEEEVIKKDISLSQFKGVGPKSVEKLKNVGFKNVFDVIIRGATEISENTELSKDEIGNIMRQSIDIATKTGIMRRLDMTVLELMKYRANQKKVSTKCAELDNLLHGGIEPETLIEVYGEFGSGKTQFCNTMCVEVLNQTDGEVLWIDCEDTFSPQRILEIAESRGYVTTDEEKEKLLGRITYYFAPNTDILMEKINDITEMILDKKIKLIVLDGTIGRFRQEYLGRSHLSERQNNLAKYVGIIHNMAFVLGCYIIMTNQVQADPGKNSLFGDPTKPIGGNIVGHTSTYRIYFKKRGDGVKRTARMVDSPKSAAVEAKFVLGVKGIEDE